MRLSSSVLLSALAVLAVGCKKSPATLDPAALSSRVSTVVSAAVAPVASVTCPPKIVVAAGTSTPCTVAFQGGGTVAVVVRQLDGAGNVEVEVGDDWLRGADIAADLTRDFAAIGETATVTCPDAVVAARPGAAYACKVVRGATTSTAKVSVDAAGTVSLALE